MFTKLILPFLFDTANRIRTDFSGYHFCSSTVLLAFPHIQEHYWFGATPSISRKLACRWTSLFQDITAGWVTLAPSPVCLLSQPSQRLMHEPPRVALCTKLCACSVVSPQALANDRITSQLFNSSPSPSLSLCARAHTPTFFFSIP